MDRKSDIGKLLKATGNLESVVFEVPFSQTPIEEYISNIEEVMAQNGYQLKETKKDSENSVYHIHFAKTDEGGQDNA